MLTRAGCWPLLPAELATRRPSPPSRSASRLCSEAAAIAANIAVLLHVGAAYQAFSMGVYLMLEEQVTKVGAQRQAALAATDWDRRQSSGACNHAA